MSVRFELLGATRAIRADGSTIRLPSAAQRRLVCALAMRSGTVVSAEWLADAFGLTPGALRMTVSRLRNLLGEGSIVTEATGYTLHAGSLDVREFEAAAAEAGRGIEGDLRAQCEVLSGALALWRGGAYSEFESEEWARAEALRLEELRAGVEERLAALLTELGEFSRAIATASVLVARHPYNDMPRALLMDALHRSGRRADALREFQAFRRLLAEEIGTEPNRALAELDWRIAASGAADGASHATPEPIARNLPARLSSFVGRRRELAELAGLLATHRLVTVSGGGGAGKTSLAQQLAAGSLERYPDGVWWLELATLPAGSPVGFLIAETLGVRLDSDLVRAGDTALLDAIARRLANERVLVVADNAEHLAQEVGVVARQLLERCPNLTILATSRVSLHVPGELVWPMPPLASDNTVDGGYPDAVQLFVERAKAARPGFALDVRSEPIVAEVCAVLDGVPLAIEFAAARSRVLDPAQILAGLADALALLGETHRAVDPRHRSIEASISWSEQLLAPRQRELLHRLSVFCASFDLAAVEAVAVPALALAAVADDLDRLVDHSLVVPSGGGQAPRFRLLETVRQYGARRLAEAGGAQETAARHAAHMRAMAAKFGPRAETADELEVVARLDLAVADLRAALTWWRDHDPDAFVSMICDLSPYWMMSGQSAEGAAWLGDGLTARQVARTSRLAPLWAHRAMMRFDIGDYGGVVEDALAAIEAAAATGDEWSLGRGLCRLAEMAGFGNLDRWRPLAERALDVCSRSGDAYGVAYMRVWQAVPYLTRGHIATGRPLLDMAEADVARSGSPTVRASFLAWTAWTAFHSGELATVSKLSAALLDGPGYRSGSQRAFVERLHFLAAQLQGMPDPLCGTIDRLIERAHRAGDPGAATPLELAAAQGALFDEPAQARARATVLLERIGETLRPVECSCRFVIAWADLVADDLRAVESGLDAIEQLGSVARWPLHRAPLLQLRALAAARRGDAATAKGQAVEAFALAEREGLVIEAVQGLEVEAIVAAAAGDRSRTVQLESTAWARRAQLGAVRVFPPLATLLDTALASSRPATRLHHLQVAGDKPKTNSHPPVRPRPDHLRHPRRHHDPPSRPPPTA